MPADPAEPTIPSLVQVTGSVLAEMRNSASELHTQPLFRLLCGCVLYVCMSCVVCQMLNAKPGSGQTQCRG